jgi:signal transduction histidine kinase
MYKVNKQSSIIIRNIFPAKVQTTKILTLLINQQTGVRAYIISKDKRFLDDYDLSNKQIQECYNDLDNLKGTLLDVYTINQLNDQLNLIEKFFKQQVTLVQNGNSDEAETHLNQGENLVDKFKMIDNILINKINLEINNMYGKVSKTEKLQRKISVFSGIILILAIFIFIKYIRHNIDEEIKKKNEINKELKKLLVSQEEFISNISHELKTPLNIIFSTVQLFEMYSQNGSLDERRESIIKHINSIKLNSYRLSKLINNIVDTAKIEAGFFELNLSNNNIIEFVEEILMSVINYTEEKEVNIIFDTNTEEKIIAFDPEKIERVVLNLISNAIKFSDKGNAIYVNIRVDDEFVEISVEDSGIGIDRNDIDIIFDRFKQVNKSLSRNVEGTGIGLNLTKSIVELHEGKIFVESELGKGSKFTFTLLTRKVMQESKLFNDNLRNKNEHVLLELSDIYS